MQGFKALSFLLLGLCLISASRLEVLHQFLHSHQHLVSHSEEQEKDPCHRTIYHQDAAEKACGHHSHIVFTDKCELCDLISHSDQLLVPQPKDPPVRIFSADIVFGTTGIISNRLSALPSRAPPFVI